MNTNLTPSELGKLWATYTGNTLGICTLQYYLKHVDDEQIQNTLEHALDLSELFAKEIKQILAQGDFPIPIGFTDDDVNLEAPRLFDDLFYLYYLQYLSKAGMSLYSVAVSLVTRKDVRNFFMEAHVKTSKLMDDVCELLASKGKLMHAPQIPIDKPIDFINDQSFLNNMIGKGRPLHGLEVAHLNGCLNNDVTSKALMLGFIQGTKHEKIRKFFERGININQKHIEGMSKKLSAHHIPSPSLLDHLVTPSATPPFSEKLMLFHKIDMFSMKIREYANGASLSGRKDLGILYAKCQLDVSLYVEDGANIMIDQGWMEQPPIVIDRIHFSGH